MTTITFTPYGQAALVFDNAAAPPSYRWSLFREVRTGPRLREFSYPRLDGADAVLLGSGPREFVQEGMLVAASESALATMMAAVRTAASGASGPLVVRGTQTLGNTVLAAVSFFGHGRAGANYAVRYALRYRQLAP